MTVRRTKTDPRKHEVVTVEVPNAPKEGRRLETTRVESGEQRERKVRRLKNPDRAKREVEHPVFDADDDVDRMLASVFFIFGKFWPPELRTEDGGFKVPNTAQYEEMITRGGKDNDIYSTLDFYLTNFYPKVPSDPKLRELSLRLLNTSEPMNAEECRYVIDYILKEHAA